MPREASACYTLIDTPPGELCIAGRGDGTVLRIDFGRHALSPDAVRDDIAMKQAADELRAYFAGTLTQFSMPIAPQGTDFQQRVWRELQQIPFGQTVSYGDIADRLGDHKAVRAVGAANGRNPISIVIPCHRVIARNGDLTGYAGGLERKTWLLAHEAGQAELLLV